MKIDLQNIIMYSDGFAKNRHQLKAYIRDIHPGIEIRTANILLNVYESGIAKQLAQMEKVSSTQYSSYINKLECDYGMTTESAIEALNAWLDVCIRKGAGTRYGNSILKAKKAAEVPSPEIATSATKKISLGANDTIFEDENVKVKFVRWVRDYYLVGGNARTGHFVFENTSNRRLCIYMKDISINGFINLAESQTSALDPKQKEMKGFPFIYENKVPGDLNDFDTVEFIVCYGEIKEGFSSVSMIKGPKNQSEIVSIKL